MSKTSPARSDDPTTDPEAVAILLELAADYVYDADSLIERAADDGFVTYPETTTPVETRELTDAEFTALSRLTLQDRMPPGVLVYAATGEVREHNHEMPAHDTFITYETWARVRVTALRRPRKGGDGEVCFMVTSYADAERG